MKIVVEGHTIDTLEIFDIKNISTSRIAGFTIQMIDKPDITLATGIGYDDFSHTRKEKYARYGRLMQAVKEQWESDKTELKVFKL